MAAIDSRAFSALALADHKAHGRTRPTVSALSVLTAAAGALHARVHALPAADRAKPAPLADLAYALRLTLASDLYVSGIPSALHALAHVEILRRHAGRQLADARVLDAELHATGRASDALDADMRKRIEVLDAQHVNREDAQDARGAYFRAVVALCQLHVFHAYTSADCDTVYQLLPAYFPAARPASDVGLESLPVSLFRRLLDEDTAANLARVNRERGELQDAYYALGAFMRASVPLEATLCTEHGLDVDAEDAGHWANAGFVAAFQERLPDDLVPVRTPVRVQALAEDVGCYLDGVLALVTTLDDLCG